VATLNDTAHPEGVGERHNTLVADTADGLRDLLAEQLCIHEEGWSVAADERPGERAVSGGNGDW
jgi:hypothetical protein